MEFLHIPPDVVPLLDVKFKYHLRHIYSQLPSEVEVIHYTLKLLVPFYVNVHMFMCTWSSTLVAFLPQVNARTLSLYITLCQIDGVLYTIFILLYM